MAPRFLAPAEKGGSLTESAARILQLQLAAQAEAEAGARVAAQKAQGDDGEAEEEGRGEGGAKRKQKRESLYKDQVGFCAGFDRRLSCDLLPWHLLVTCARASQTAGWRDREPAAEPLQEGPPSRRPGWSLALAREVVEDAAPPSPLAPAPSVPSVPSCFVATYSAHVQGSDARGSRCACGTKNSTTGDFRSCSGKPMHAQKIHQATGFSRLRVVISCL